MTFFVFLHGNVHVWLWKNRSSRSVSSHLVCQRDRVTCRETANPNAFSWWGGWLHPCTAVHSINLYLFLHPQLSKWLKRMKTGWGAREKRSVCSPAHLYWGVCNKQRQKYWLRSAVKQAALNIAQKTRRILCIQWFCCWNAAHIWAIKRISKQHLKQHHKHRYQLKKKKKRFVSSSQHKSIHLFRQLIGIKWPTLLIALPLSVRIKRPLK